MTTASKRRPSRSRASAVSAVQPGRSAFAPGLLVGELAGDLAAQLGGLALAGLPLRREAERRVLLVGGREPAVEGEALVGHHGTGSARRPCLTDNLPGAKRPDVIHRGQAGVGNEPDPSFATGLLDSLITTA